MSTPWDALGAGDQPPEPPPDLELSILGVAVAPDEDEEGVYRLVLRTSRGDIRGMFTVVEGGTGCAIMVSGASGGFSGPANNIYSRVAQAIRARGVSSLRLDYRLPNEFEECVLDVLAGASFLKGIGAERIVLLGHSFGGAVVIRAGTLAPLISGVVAMSSQLHGTQEVADLSPRPLLLIHGMDDQVLEATASEILFERAQDPKRLVIYAGAGHSLVQSQVELYDLLTEWIPEHALPAEDAQ